MMVLVVLFILVTPIIVLAQESTSPDDCTWLCQVVEWFKGEGTVVGEALGMMVK